jgi:cell division protein FtsW (lipid II flippase)
MPQKLVLRNRRKSFLQQWNQVDWLLMAVYAGMTVFGGVMIYSVNLG